MTRLSTMIRQIPTDGQTIDDVEPPRVIQAIGDDYDTALTALEGQMPNGYQMLGIYTHEP